MLPLHLNTKTRRSDSCIEAALKFIFQSQNIQLLSWGTKRLKIAGEWVRFPALMRRKTAEKMHRDYEAHMSSCSETTTNEETSKPFSRSVFLQIVQCLTRGQLNRKAAVDYVLGTLVYDNLRTVRDVVGSELQHHDEQKLFLSQLEAVEEFLKFTMLEQIASDTDPMHDPDFALDESRTQKENVESNCTTCLSPFQVVDNITQKVDPARDDILDVLRDASEKMMLYRGHQHRCHNQEKRIAQIFNMLRDDPSMSRAVVLLDYKMKFEAIRYREKTTEFYGKKGISWHGAAIFYRRVEGAGGTDTPHANIETLFFDHVSSNDMTQDCMAVASILDVILARLKIELPTVTDVTILSDNARCYQNDILPVIAPYIAKRHDLFLAGIVHFETQRGKSLLDAHFAIAMMHVNNYCRETRRDVTTPGDIVTALNSFGGVANCTAEMVHISKTNDELRKWIASKKENKLVALGRVNEVLYSPWENDKIKATCFKLSGRESTEYQFMKYSSATQKANTEESNNTDSASQNDLQQSDHSTVDDPMSDNDGEITTEGAGEGNIIHHSRPTDVAYHGVLTGVLVWSRSRLRRQWKRRKVKTNSSNEIQRQADILDEEHAVLESEHSSSSNVDSIEETQPVLRECPKCKKGYRRSDYFSKHIQVCQGQKPSMDFLDRACRMAFQMLKNSELSIYTTKARHPGALTISISNEVRERMSQKAGWAQRPAYGKTLGNNTVRRYAEDIQELFDAGQADKGKKMSASIMRDVLRKKYPERYDVPSEHFITGYVSSLVRKHKKRVENMNREGGPEPARAPRTVMANIYVEKLQELVRSEQGLMPRLAVAALMNALDLSPDALPADFPSEKAIKAKVSSIRAQVRKEAG